MLRPGIGPPPPSARDGAAYRGRPSAARRPPPFSFTSAHTDDPKRRPACMITDGSRCALLFARPGRSPAAQEDLAERSRGIFRAVLHVVAHGRPRGFLGRLPSPARGSVPSVGAWGHHDF